MENDRKKLNLLTPFLILSGLALLIVVLMSILSMLSEQRKKEVHERYYRETLEWAKKNQKNLEYVFGAGFVRDCSTNQYNAYTCAYGKNVAPLLSNDIQDFSSIMFLKDVGSGHILSMRLSGQYQDIFSGDEHIADYQKMLSGEVSQLPWDEYFYELQGKEVLVPVKDSSGKVMGVVVRGVIEKQ